MQLQNVGLSLWQYDPVVLLLTLLRPGFYPRPETLPSPQGEEKEEGI